MNDQVAIDGTPVDATVTWMGPRWVLVLRSASEPERIQTVRSLDDAREAVCIAAGQVVVPEIEFGRADDQTMYERIAELDSQIRQLRLEADIFRQKLFRSLRRRGMVEREILQVLGRRGSDTVTGRSESR